MQLIDTSGLRSDKRIFCDEGELTALIETTIIATGRRFELLIDGLNSLSYPPDPAATQLLRTVFLDPRPRYLVFSTNLPIYIDPVCTASVAGQLIGSDSNIRGAVYVDMPESFDLKAIQAIAPSCSVFTLAEVALCGDIHR